jgi:hypothetical protein
MEPRPVRAPGLQKRGLAVNWMELDGALVRFRRSLREIAHGICDR